MNWSDLRREAAFVCGYRSVLAVWLLGLVLSTFAVVTGLVEIDQQRKSIERLLVQDRLDRQSVLDSHHDFGSLAYYSFHLTYLPPSSTAFAALGQRDVMPWKHRIRMLALEGQIHENDSDNPELSLVGRFDFAFLMSVLMPLLMLLLLHDVRARERAAGRYDLLLSTATSAKRLWLARTLVLLAGLAGALLLPFIVAALYSGASLYDTALIVLISIGLMAVWALVCVYLSALNHSGPRIASLLLACWLLTAVVLPSVIEPTIEAVVDTPNGGDIVLTQREAVNDAWDLPFDATFEPFMQRHRAFREYTQMDALFEWKWYYAFQQVGDQTAEPLSTRYRDALAEKDQWAGWAAWLSPSLWYQRTITQIAGTDFDSAARYDAQVRDFHGQLRAFYYPYLFLGTDYDAALMDARPEFRP